LLVIIIDERDSHHVYIRQTDELIAMDKEDKEDKEDNEDNEQLGKRKQCDSGFYAGELKRQRNFLFFVLLRQRFSPNVRGPGFIKIS
jgi:hypothetical protein